jgi:hypothetical protein
MSSFLLKEMLKAPPGGYGGYGTQPPINLGKIQQALVLARIPRLFYRMRFDFLGCLSFSRTL